MHLHLFFSFQILQQTWTIDPEKRPTFAELLPELENLQGSALYQVSSLFLKIANLTVISTLNACSERR